MPLPPPAPSVPSTLAVDFKAFLKREWAIFYDMLKSSYLNWLLVVSPIAIGLGFAHSSHIAVFVTVGYRDLC